MNVNYPTKRNEGIARRKMSEHEDMEGLKRKVYLWLKKQGFPEANYDKLPPNMKGILHRVVCTVGYITTYNQRAELWLKLSVPQAMRDRLVESIPPDEELRKIFSPLTPKESLDDLHKH